MTPLPDVALPRCPFCGMTGPYVLVYTPAFSRREVIAGCRCHNPYPPEPNPSEAR